MKTIELKVIDPILAEQLLKTVDHDAQRRLQRKLDLDYVEFLSDEMRRREFSDVSVIHLMHCRENGLTYLVNGQHTLHAVIRSGIPVSVTVREQDAVTYNEVALSYCTYDNGRSRVIKDSIRATNAPEQLNLSSEEIGSRIVPSIKYIFSEFERRKVKRLNRNALIRAAGLYAESFSIFKECIFKGDGDITTKLYGRPYLSIALLTIRFHPQKAREFWQQVAHGDKLPNNSPAFVLRKNIAKYRVMGGENKKGEAVQVETLTKIAAVCWNAFYENRPKYQLRLNSSKITEIAGIYLPKIYNELNQILVLDYSSGITDTVNIAYSKTDFSKIKGNDFYYEYEGTQLERVTSYVKKLHPAFNKDEIAQKQAQRLNRSVEQIKLEWELKGKQGRELGEKVHQYIQERLSGVVIDELRYRLNGSTPKEFDSFDSFWSTAVNELTPSRIEWIVGDIEYKLGGRVDALFRHPTDGYILADFKTGRIEEWDRDKFYPPFDDIPNDALYHYSFQLSLYKIIIERNTNIKIEKLWIVHLKPDGSYEIIPAEDYSYRLKSYLSTP